MTDIVGSIVKLLVEGNYEAAKEPLRVADVAFEFEAVLQGPQPQKTMVLVAQVGTAEIRELWRRVKALTLTLERSESSCPLSLVVVATEPSPDEISRLRQLCRVLIVPNDIEQDALRDELAILLPLPLIERRDLGESRSTALRERLEEKLAVLRSDESISELVTDLMASAEKGKSNVERSFLDHVRRQSTLSEDTR